MLHVLHYLDCLRMSAGKKPETISAKIESILLDAIFHQPSVVLLEDLDTIAEACSGPDQELAPETLYHARVALGTRVVFAARRSDTF